VISTVPYERNMANHINRITLVTVVSIIPMVLMSKRMGTQVAHEGTDMLTRTIQTQENTKGQIMLS